jgi:hypothetical protein
MNEEESRLRMEAQRATEMLRGKTVSVVWRHRPGEAAIQFADGQDCLLITRETPTR